MKKIYNSYPTWLRSLLLSLPFLALVACSPEEEKLVVEPKTAPALSVAQPTDKKVTITAENLESKAQLTWSKANYGTDQISVVYRILLAVEKTQKEFTVDLSTNALEWAPSYEELNDLVIGKLGVVAGEEATVKVRVTADPLREEGQVTKALKTLASEPVALQVQTYKAPPKVGPAHFFVGDMFDHNQWNINSTDFIFFRNNAEDREERYIGWFKPGAQFKIVRQDNIGNWGAVIGMKDGALFFGDGGNNIDLMPDGGYYEVVYNVEAFTLSVKPFNEAGKKRFDKIGIVGDGALGWDQDTFLDQAPYDPHIWIKRGVQLNVGEIKFRANADWADNWGGDAFGPFGTGFNGGPNWKITEEDAGAYTVYFNDLTGWFAFIKE